MLFISFLKSSDEHLVTSVIGTDKEIEVTVLTDGMLISGKLISGHKYLSYVKSELTFDEKLSEAADLQNYKLKRLSKAP